MKDRPLCCVCLLIFLLQCVAVCAGREKVVKELVPSPLECRVQEGEEISLTGRLYKNEIKEDYQILYLKNNSITYQEQSFTESRVIVYDKEKTEVHIGQMLRADGEVSFFDPAYNPGNFDRKLYYQKQDIHASVWTGKVEVSDDRANAIADTLYRFRQKWSQMFGKYMGEEDGAVLAAMILGEKSGMDAELKELYQVNGVGHVLAKKCTNESICV